MKRIGIICHSSINRRVIGVGVLSFFLWATFSPAEAEPMVSSISDIRQHAGALDGSAAAPLGEDLFVAANDEDNVLRVYRRDIEAGPIVSFPLDVFLEVDRDRPEADLEAACEIDGTVYWITSHGANKNGKPRSSRRRLFATRFRVEPSGVEIEHVGRPYKDLLKDLVAHPALESLHLAKAATVPPKNKGGLNIEGMCSTPEGGLLIGFRNPIPKAKALLVPVLNPEGLTTRGEAAELGAPIRLDLGGLGIRGLARHGEEYLILAGAFNKKKDFALYRWKGEGSEPEKSEGPDFGNLNPETMAIDPNLGLRRVQFFSDDGSLIDREKNLARFPAFRSFWVEFSE